MAKEFESYARECVLLARLADSVELGERPNAQGRRDEQGEHADGLRRLAFSA